ncbi:head maturation protease, ClpP-related [Clostridium akagii]|uniref:head maturation protease, ClpP-related n=1 Tax=Clostridium akagii TaxID=91623 RepID=UPI000691801A|nr:head maturation protease, ClpP-related [Clostridium akagii]
MPKIYQFTKKDKTGNIKNVGKMEIKNQSNNSADLYFYGDIVSIAYNAEDWWSFGDPEDKAPQDVADFLNELDGMTDVNIHINSGGGDVFAGIAIYNILKSNDANKTTYVDGLAASAASIIALAGNTVIIPSSAQFMIHNAWTFAQGNANDFRQTADWLDQIGLSLVNIYMDNAKDGVTEEQIKQMMDDETWMTGEQTSEYFNVQVDKTATVAACANSEFFGKYKHLPKSLAKKEPQAAKNSQDSNSEILKALNKINNKLEELEKTVIEEPKLQDNKTIEQLKAKLALECTL